MIADSLMHAARYYGLHPLFRSAFEYLRRVPHGTPDGRHPIDGDRLYALPKSYETVPRTERGFEAHRRYIDIHFVLLGEEVIYHTPVERLEIREPYHEDRDIMFFREPLAASPTFLRAGDFGVYFPHDAHKPGCLHTAPMAVRKILLKVAV
jgi:YhcH/YjgK/YiaL family protein